MTKRISGDTLAMRLRVAMTPTVQPAAAGTHQDLERCFLTAVTVIGREDMRSTNEMGESAHPSSIRCWLPNWPGVLFSRAVTRVVGCGAGFAEGQLEALQAVADRTRMRSEELHGCGDQAGECGDQSACLVQIAVWAVIGFGCGQPELLGGCAHEHDRRTGDHFDGGG